jgi:hypothetical protein
MIDLLLERAAESRHEAQVLREISAHVAAVKASAGVGDRGQVARIEAAVQSDPEGAFEFDASSTGTLRVLDAHIPAGRFVTLSLRDLRSLAVAAGRGAASGRVRLWILDGISPATDIGSLQATAGPGTLFQVASQFNCLESPVPSVTRVANYFGDSTQGPRASISAFTGTLLRHYAAPGPGNRRFVQSTDGPQINLLDAVCSPGVARVRNGYLASADIADPSAFLRTLESRFDDICVGVHDHVPVLLGYNWDGAVTGQRFVGQVFTSTFAGGAYSGVNPDDPTYRPICSALLRAAYLGTLLAAAALNRRKVVLTLIGGGVFGNPIGLIWESILWAIGEVEPVVGEMAVVVNGRNLLAQLSTDKILPDVRARGGAVVVLNSNGAEIRR